MTGVHYEVLNPVSSPAHSGLREATPIAVIGTGNVGGALLDLLAERDHPGLELVALANSRRMLFCEEGITAAGVVSRLDGEGEVTDIAALETRLHGLAGQAIIVDLTASAAVAATHSHWLKAGFSVVTANKWAASGDGSDNQALLATLGQARTGYRYSTTVGAGLPLLETIRRLHQSGDRIHSVAGLFSGTLSFLMKGLGDGRAFSECVHQAQQQGLTEPDPRLDLSGVDVARKLVITARAAGIKLDLADVDIESLVPEALATWPLDCFLQDGEPYLDAAWQDTLAQRSANGVPRYVGSVDHSGTARVGIQWLEVDHPFATVGPTDNIFEIRSDSYQDTPILIRGPGAGARVTAVQVLADVLGARASFTISY